MVQIDVKSNFRRVLIPSQKLRSDDFAGRAVSCPKLTEAGSGDGHLVDGAESFFKQEKVITTAMVLSV